MADFELEYDTLYDREARYKIFFVNYFKCNIHIHVQEEIFKHVRSFTIILHQYKDYDTQNCYFFMKNCKFYCKHDKIILKGIHKNLKLGMYAFLLRYINALHLTSKNHLTFT